MGEDRHRYRVVDDYYRQEHFDYYLEYACPFYHATVEIDATAVVGFAKANEYSLYANLCYFFTRAATPIEDFRYRLRDGEIVLYEELHPGLTVPAPGGRFSYCYLYDDPDVHAFNRRAREEMAAAGRGVSLAESDHDNFLYTTALPQVPFVSFGHAWNETTDACPRVAFGRLRSLNGRLLVPIGLQINHLFIDGGALGELCQRLEAAYAAVEGDP